MAIFTGTGIRNGAFPSYAVFAAAAKKGFAQHAEYVMFLQATIAAAQRKYQGKKAQSVRACVCALRACVRVRVACVHACVRACVQVCMHVRACLCASMHACACVHACKYACMYVRACVRACVHVCMHNVCTVCIT